VTKVQTPATIVAAATALIPLVGTLNKSGDPAKQAKAQELDAGISAAIDQASSLASQDVIDLLAKKDGALEQLQALDAKAKTEAAKIAAEEQRVADAISFVTTSVKFAVAVVAGSLPAAATDLQTMLDALHIA
jgi:hypothetical protein